MICDESCAQGGVRYAVQWVPEYREPGGGVEVFEGGGAEGGGEGDVGNPFARVAVVFVFVVVGGRGGDLAVDGAVTAAAANAPKSTVGCRAVCGVRVRSRGSCRCGGRRRRSPRPGACGAGQWGGLTCTQLL